MAKLLSRREFEQAHQYHREYLGECWSSCTALAEKSIGHRPNEDDLDRNVRAETVSDLAKLFLVKNSLDLSEFITLVESPKRRRRR